MFCSGTVQCVALKLNNAPSGCQTVCDLGVPSGVLLGSHTACRLRTTGYAALEPQSGNHTMCSRSGQSGNYGTPEKCLRRGAPEGLSLGADFQRGRGGWPPLPPAPTQGVGWLRRRRRRTGWGRSKQQSTRLMVPRGRGMFLSRIFLPQ